MSLNPMRKGSSITSARKPCAPSAKRCAGKNRAAGSSLWGAHAPQSFLCTQFRERGHYLGGLRIAAPREQSGEAPDWAREGACVPRKPSGLSANAEAQIADRFGAKALFQFAQNVRAIYPLQLVVQGGLKDVDVEDAIT